MPDSRQAGERRSRKFTMYYEEPWDVASERIPHERYLRTYLDRMAEVGWKFERVLKQYRDTVPTFSQERGKVRTYYYDVLLSKPLRTFVIQVPDKVVTAMLRNPQIGPLITDIT